MQSPTDAWAVFGMPLMIVQTTMAFEIVHAMLGMVRSPVFVTTLQVMSRLWVIYGATFYATSSQVEYIHTSNEFTRTWHVYLLRWLFVLLLVFFFFFFVCLSLVSRSIYCFVLYLRF
jgi:hypothetical protein